jgi:hypothetical protein
MAANSHFLALLAQQGNWWNAAYFVFILGSLFCLGGVLESRPEFVLLEAARIAGIAIAAFGPGVWFGGIRDRKVILPIAAFALSSPAGSWFATPRRVPATAERGVA